MATSTEAAEFDIGREAGKCPQIARNPENDSSSFLKVLKLPVDLRCMVEVILLKNSITWQRDVDHPVKPEAVQKYPCLLPPIVFAVPSRTRSGEK